MYCKQGTDSFLNASEMYRRDKEELVCSYRILRREFAVAPRAVQRGGRDNRDVFTKSEKWLGSPLRLQRNGFHVRKRSSDGLAT